MVDAGQQLSPAAGQVRGQAALTPAYTQYARAADPQALADSGSLCSMYDGGSTAVHASGLRGVFSYSDDDFSAARFHAMLCPMQLLDRSRSSFEWLAFGLALISSQCGGRAVDGAPQNDEVATSSEPKGSRSGNQSAGGAGSSIGTMPPSMSASPPAATLTDTGPGTPECMGIDGTIVIASQADADRYTHCAVINNIYVYHITSPLVINWPELIAVTGMVYFDHATGLQSVSLPRLNSIGAELYLDGNTALVGVSLPALIRIVGDQSNGNAVYVRGNSALLVIAAPLLATVGGYAYVDENPELCQQPDWATLTSNDQEDHLVTGACGSSDMAGQAGMPGF